MIPRYTPAVFAELWSSDRRFAVWLEVELAARAHRTGTLDAFLAYQESRHQ